MPDGGVNMNTVLKEKRASHDIRIDPRYNQTTCQKDNKKGCTPNNRYNKIAIDPTNPDNLNMSNMTISMDSN
jgi:hypothetical protein